MLIGVCGYGYTGSGAVVDLLREYDENEVHDEFELSIAYIPDGLKDLEYHLMLQPNRYMSSDIAIQRFIKYIEGKNGKGSALRIKTQGQFKSISMEYIEGLVQESWNGFWGYDFIVGNFWKRNFQFRLLYQRVIKPIEKKLNRAIMMPPYRKMYFSIEPDSFYEKTKAYMNKLIGSFSELDKENLVLNQPFPANCPESCFCFFESPKAIIVDKDPRDTYLLAKKVIKSGASWMPVDDVRQFVVYYKQMRLRKSDRKDVLYVQYEDLIYHYEETVKKIENFLAIEMHYKPKEFFDPEISIGNTQLFLRYPEYKEDIEYIERELEEYLYSFEKCRKPSDDTEPFDK